MPSAHATMIPASSSLSSAHLLLLAGALNIVAAALHLVCIVVGERAFEFMGAGPAMVRMAAAGHWYPTVVTLAITSILLVFAYYAFAGARLLPAPPMLRVGLAFISCIYLARALVIVPVLVAAAQGATRFHLGGAGGSISFWVWSSLICLIFGVAHLAGTVAAWSRL